MYIYSHWCLSPNFGDQLTPYIIKKISGKSPIWVNKNESCVKYLVVGSILNWECDHAIVWGCGVANKTDTINISDIRAVRGPLSAYIARTNGINVPEIYGDPALLLPKLYFPKTPSKKYKVGIIPHYVDLKLVLDKINHEDITIINLFNPIEEIIDSIVSCEKVYSSSLHGIIVSHAYNIPCEWVKFSNNILGDNTKFWDYYMSIGETSYRSPMNLMEDTINPDFLISNNINYPNLKINLDILWESCPFLNL